MADRFEDILNDCIDRIVAGESLEQCLARYPEHVPRLEPLVRVAVAAHRTSSDIRPGDDFRARARYQMRALLNDRKQKAPSRSVPVLGWLPRWAAAVIIAVVVVLGAGSGTVMAASNSLPGDFLYPVKMATERVRLAFSFSDEGTADLHARFAEERAEEMARLVETNRAEKLQEVMKRLQDHLEQVESLAVKVQQQPAEVQEKWLPLLKERLRQSAVRDAVRLDAAEERATEAVKPIISQYRSELAEAYRNVVKSLSGSDAQEESPEGQAQEESPDAQTQEASPDSQSQQKLSDSQLQGNAPDNKLTGETSGNQPQAKSLASA